MSGTIAAMPKTWGDRFREGVNQAVVIGGLDFLLAYYPLGVEGALISAGIAALVAYGRVMGVAGLASARHEKPLVDQDELRGAGSNGP